jgi:hypothetical protein
VQLWAGKRRALRRRRKRAVAEIFRDNVVIVIGLTGRDPEFEKNISACWQARHRPRRGASGVWRERVSESMRGRPTSPQRPGRCRRAGFPRRRSSPSAPRARLKRLRRAVPGKQVPAVVPPIDPVVTGSRKLEAQFPRHGESPEASSGQCQSFTHAPLLVTLCPRFIPALAPVSLFLGPPTF